MKKTILICIFISFILFTAGSQELKKKDSPSFSVSPGFSLTIPVGEFAPAFSLAYTPTAFVSYNVSFPWGILGFGVLSGCSIQPTSAEAAYQANLLSIPAAASVRYTTNFASRLFGFVEATGGMAVNMVLYKAEYPDRSNTTAIKPFLLPEAGLGLRLTPGFSVATICGFMMIFYDDAPYMGVSPGISAGFDL